MKYKTKKGTEVEEIDLEAKDALLITAIDNLTKQIRIFNGR